jgi:hypothetical protein
MQTIQFLVLATAIAALIAGLNVSQVAHAQKTPGTCVVGSNANNNPTSNPVSGNPHCFDPEQQPAGSSATTALPGDVPAMGNGACAAGTGGQVCNHPQSTNPQGKIVGNPHEEPLPGSGCQVPPNPNSCGINPQNSVVGNPHVPTR